jgi:hypothetical protein
MLQDWGCWIGIIALKQYNSSKKGGKEREECLCKLLRRKEKRGKGLII